MPRKNWRELISATDRWMNTPPVFKPELKTLRWWITPNRLDKYVFRVILLASFSIALYLVGCNSSAASTGQEYIGSWEHKTTTKNSLIADPSKTAIATNFDILTITKDGDHFLVKQTKKLDDGFGKTFDLGSHTYPATLRDGILQLADGSSRPYTYVKASDTLITRGSEHDVEYRRSKQQ